MEKFRKIDHYQLLQILGKGANGLVYKGLNTANGSMVAIKQMIIGKSEIKVIKAQLNILKQLDHPCIVKYIDAVQKQNKIYLILQYMEGGSLGALVRKSPVEEEVAKIFIKQVLNGLVFLHKSQVIHRDIKGANLLLTKNGQVKLADFGVAVKLEDGQKTISAAGSPYWMAPEIISSDAQPSTKCDIWSLGCTVIQLLTGNPPYYELMQFPALFRIVQDKHPPLPECSPECKQFLLLCFIKNPKDRPTAMDLLNSAWLKSVNEGQIAQLHEQNELIAKQVSSALFPNINYQQLQKIVKQNKNSLAICKHKYFQSVIYDNRQNNPNAARIQLMISLIRNDKNSFQYIYKTGIFGQQFQKLKQKYEPSEQFTVLFYHLITILIQLYSIFVKEAEINTKLCQHNPPPNIELIQTMIIHKGIPSLSRLLYILGRDKKYNMKYDLMVSLHQFMISAINHNDEQASQQMINSVTKSLDESGQLKQTLTLDLQPTRERQYNMSILKLEIIVKILPSLLFLHEIKPATFKKHIAYLITQLLANGFVIQNQSILITKLMCLNILTANDQLKACMQRTGIIYYLSKYYQHITTNLNVISVAALLESVAMLAKLLENNKGGIDKNRVVQFARHHGAESLQIIFQSIQSQNKNRKKQSNSLVDKLSMVIAILQNYRQ